MKKVKPATVLKALKIKKVAIQSFLKGLLENASLKLLNISFKLPQIVLNVNNVWYYGKHDTLEQENRRDRILNKDTTRTSIKGIIIGYDEDSNTR
jgi:hypothetical protein